MIGAAEPNDLPLGQKKTWCVKSRRSWKGFNRNEMLSKEGSCRTAKLWERWVFICLQSPGCLECNIFISKSGGSEVCIGQNPDLRKPFEADL